MTGRGGVCASLHSICALMCAAGHREATLDASDATACKLVLIIRRSADKPSNMGQKLPMLADIADNGCEAIAIFSLLAGGKSHGQAEMAVAAQQLMAAELTAELKAAAVMLASVYCWHAAGAAGATCGRASRASWRLFSARMQKNHTLPAGIFLHAKKAARPAVFFCSCPLICTKSYFK